MKMSGERVIPAPQVRVWEALNDPEVLRQSVPGCQEMVKHSPTEFSAKLQAKVGPVKANFAGNVTLSDLDPPNSYRISGQGTGGAAGFAEGGADVRLYEVDGQTRLTYDVDAKVGGKLAQIGSRLIDSTARKMADDFFRRFSDVVTGDAPATAGQPDAPAELAETALAPPAETEAPAAKKTAAKKTAAKKTAAKKSAKKAKASKAAAKPERRGRAGTMEDPVPAPSLMPEAAIAASAATHREPDQPATQQPAPGNNLWWLVGAGIAALLVILVLATV
jgi:uncharacterized protein